MAVRGRASTKSTERGRSKPPRRGRQKARISSSRADDARPKRDDRLHRLAPALVGHADDRGLGDRGMREEHVLDDAGIHVLAAGDDHVLDAVLDEQVAVVIDAPDVAGVQPSVGERLRGLVRALPIAAHQLRAAREDLAGFSSRPRRIACVGHSQLGRRRPVGLPTAAAQVASRARAGGRRPRGTSAPARPRSCRRTAQSRSRTRRSPAAACLRRSARRRSRSSAGVVVAVGDVVDGDETGLEHGGDERGDTDPLLLEHGTTCSGSNASSTNERAAAAEHREDGRDDRRVEHRQHDQTAISGGDGMRQADLDDVRRSPRHGSAPRPWARPSYRSCTSDTARRRR